jgi:transcriptional regulator with XRE-family HTH domain
MTAEDLGRWESLEMVQKSIRQLAKEIGVSASYLSQISD